jgi:la-related protein 1
MNGTVPSGPNGEPVAFPHPGNPSEGAAVYPGHHGAAVNGDSFSDEQVESLSVISRKQDPALAADKSRSFSNGSINGHSHSDELQNAEPQQNGAQLNGHVPAQV